MLIGIKKWHIFANSHSDGHKNGPNDPEWDPYFGSKYIKARQKFSHEIEVMDDDCRGSEDLDFCSRKYLRAILGICFWSHANAH
jgi:hypothetical protein